MEKQPLTARQSDVLAFIRSEIRRHARPPTVREIGLQFGLRSTGSVRDHLQALLRKGHITYRRNQSRGIGLADRSATGPGSHPPRRIPVLGAIAAGQPILAEENYEGAIDLDRGMFAADEVFALRVRGDSMRDAGILDGDYVFVRRGSEVKNRDIVAVLIDEEATVKRYFHEGRRVRLEPENTAMKPIYIKPAEAKVRILGKVVGSMREY